MILATARIICHLAGHSDLLLSHRRSKPNSPSPSLSLWRRIGLASLQQANDVANSFATSVSSKSLTLRQACIAAAIFEFLGAVTVGARTASTIKNGIVPATIFQGNAGLQLLTFVNAIFISSVWLSM